MYGRIKEQKLRNNDVAFSVQQVKNELECFIDDENKRVNIDSAKKRAVTQANHRFIKIYLKNDKNLVVQIIQFKWFQFINKSTGMDYEGFRQMVLGAHLFCIKSKELIDMSADRTNKKNEIVLNSSLTTFNNVVDLSMRQKEEIEQINLRIAQMLANNELQATNFREFKRNFDSQYKENLDDIAAQNIYLQQILINFFAIIILLDRINQSIYFLTIFQKIQYILYYAQYQIK